MKNTFTRLRNLLFCFNSGFSQVHNLENKSNFTGQHKVGTLMLPQEAQTLRLKLLLVVVIMLFSFKNQGNNKRTI
jgi:hypothetical protein